MDATADAEDRHLAVVGQTGDEQFGQVALGVDAAEGRLRLLALIERVDVGTAAEQEGIDAVECGKEHLAVAVGRYDERCAASLQHLLVVAFGQFGVLFAVVGGDADDGSLAGWEAVVATVGLLMEVETVHASSMPSK